MSVRGRLVISFLILVGFAMPVRAADRFNLISIHPNPDLGHYFFVQESKTLPQFKWSLGQYTVYDYKLLNVNRRTITTGRGGATTVDERHTSMDHLLYQYYYGSFGLFDRIELMCDFPFFLFYNYGYTTTDTPTSDYYRLSPGDVRLAAKANLLDLNNYPLGISFLTAVSIPTGKEDRFLGEDSYTVENGLILEAKPVERLRLAFNAAFQTREQVAINDLYFRDYIKLAMGVNYKMLTDLSLIAEFEAQTPVRDFFESRNTSPAETRIGVRWYPGGREWFLGGGGSAGILYGKGMPRTAGFINFGYTAGHLPEEIQTVAPVSFPVAVPPTAVVSPPSRLLPKSLLPLGLPAMLRKAMRAGEKGVRQQPPPEDNTQPAGPAPCSVIYTAFFNFNSAVVDETDIALKQAVGCIAGNREITVIDLRGWTDTAGPRWYNKKLSKRRAESVEMYMRKNLGSLDGINVSTLAIGEDIISPPGEARRVEIVIK